MYVPQFLTSVKQMTLTGVLTGLFIFLQVTIDILRISSCEELFEDARAVSTLLARKLILKWLSCKKRYKL